ncbi:hypothetical protein BPUTSESOX_148 [uncultured Gammaproteobacteria bacterium]|nr:hypothetical protein [uncultured Gammaproteobacteria bacterium]VVH50445.1 hypothetical protein BPUTSESOX_148 [uncultured Gammaproteobacteria bacterium]
MWCWIKSSFVDLDGWKNGWFWFGLGWFLRGDYLGCGALVVNHSTGKTVKFLDFIKIP